MNLPFFDLILKEINQFHHYHGPSSYEEMTDHEKWDCLEAYYVWAKENHYDSVLAILKELNIVVPKYFDKVDLTELGMVLYNVLKDRKLESLTHEQIICRKI